MKAKPIDLSMTDEQLWLQTSNASDPAQVPARWFVGPESIFPARSVLKVGIRPTGRKGEISLGMARADVASHSATRLVLTGEESPADVVWMMLDVPRLEDEADEDVNVFLSHVLFYPVDRDQRDEYDESHRANRIAAETERWSACVAIASMRTNDPGFILGRAERVVSAIWSAVEDLDDVPRSLDPVDVLEKHIQRGNIMKDGKW